MLDHIYVDKGNFVPYLWDLKGLCSLCHVMKDHAIKDNFVSYLSDIKDLCSP